MYQLTQLAGHLHRQRLAPADPPLQAQRDHLTRAAHWARRAHARGHAQRVLGHPALARLVLSIVRPRAT